MEKITEDSFVTLEGLVELLQTSESTVRRDLDELEGERKLHRVHGGAELHHSLREELTNKQKSIKNVHHKSLVANKASTLINDGDVIFIDAGTTTELLVDLLYQENLTVVTDSIHHAAKLVDKNFKTPLVKSSATSSLITRVPEVKLFGLSQTKYLRFYTCEVV